MPRGPVERIRLQLTAWYVVTFCIILALLGGGLFVIIRGQLSSQLDDSLHSATTELARAARIRETESASAQGQVVDAVDELHIPDRQLFLLTTSGVPVKPAATDTWIRNAAIRAADVGSIDEDRELPAEKTLRLHAERFTLESGAAMVAVAVADKVELEDRYAALIGVFGGAAMVALLMVALGGSILVGKSAAPVERTMDQMRQFMADAAHELRTPITVLRSRAEVALQQPRDRESYIAALQGVESESIRLGRIVDDLLMLARADAGDRPIERKSFLLDEIVLDAAAAAGSVAQSRQVSVTLDDLDRALIEGDSALVRQLVMILLDNAIKFTPEGGEVRVRVASIDGRVTLIVEDSGIGIPPDQLQHVFDRFYRGDRARGRSEGAGLGLSIARWIADAHRAEIRIDSTSDRGTLVEVVFPVSRPAP
ncbi:MAG TPA: HAMP domain-containing sensor histidine kinase [Gemmatimonadaceae bacterium]